MQIAAAAAALIISSISVAQASIQYNGTNLQSDYAATTTNQVNDVINNVIQGKLGATSTTDVQGIVSGAQNALNNGSDWVQNQSGINLRGILGTIGHFIVSAAGFIINLIKGAL